MEPNVSAIPTKPAELVLPEINNTDAIEMFRDGMREFVPHLSRPEEWAALIALADELYVAAGVKQ